MKQQFMLMAISLVYWVLVAVIMVALVNAWPWLANSPWLFVIFAPFFIFGFLVRMILRKRILGRKRIQS